MRHLCLATLAICGLIASEANADQHQPTDWLQRMGTALEEASFRGVVIRQQPSKTDTFKIYHTVRDGVIRERLIRQEGDGLEIIRNGNEVHCVIPDKQAVLVEPWNGQGTLFSPIEDEMESIAAAYDFQLTGQDRVAGRDAVIVSIKPKDEMRFARRLWLDEKTGFPLKSERVDVNGALVERIRFADIELGAELVDGDFESRYVLDDFKWYPAAEPQTNDDKTGWYAASLPAGYRMESGRVERLDRGGAVVTHIVYTDGLSRVSVFIKTGSGSAGTTRNRMGNANSFSVRRGDYRITAVGEVPPAAVEQIALSMQR